MTFALCGKIVFAANSRRPELIIYRFSEFETSSSYKQLTDTAKIVLPRKTRDFNRFSFSEMFAEGDAVEIYAGYDGEMNLEYSGYISAIDDSIPVVLRCEDEMYHLKRTTVSIVKESCSLKELLTACAVGRSVDCDDTQLGAVRYSKVTAAAILDDLRKQGINCFFRGKVLTGIKLVKAASETVPILLEKTAAKSLKQKSVEKVFVRVISHGKMGGDLKYEYGDEGGTVITLEHTGLDKTEIEVIGKAAYERAKAPGLDGEITIWGIPRIEHGMAIELDSTLYPKMKGTYYVDSVKKRLSRSTGFKQYLTLGIKTA